MTDASDQTFPRSQRLTSASQYRHVFAEPLKAGKNGFVVLYRSNDLGTPRLGLAIAKKSARRSVDRNRLKRIVRESFRSHRHMLPGVDIVVLCDRGARTQSNQRLFQLLERSWGVIGKTACVQS